MRLEDDQALIRWSADAERLDPLAREKMRAWMLSMLEELPDLPRIIFVLRDLEDWDTGEIASRLGMTPSSVRRSLHGARMFIQGRLRAKN